MKLSQLKAQLPFMEELLFVLPNGSFVPKHFHVTEVGQVTKHFIDCGGTVRNEKVVNFQLWNASDTSHRLEPQKLTKIISLSEKILGVEDAEIEVEFQSDTVGKYGLEYNGEHFILTAKQTACLASDSCGTGSKQKIKLGESAPKESCCTPGGGCC